MSNKVKLSKDGSSIDFVQSDTLPTSIKKFRQSPEIEGFYRFIHENDLQKEAFEILNQIIVRRKQAKGTPAKAEKAVQMAAPAPTKLAKVASKKVTAAAPKAVVAKKAPAAKKAKKVKSKK